MTDAQLALGGAAYRAGFRAQPLRDFVAICSAESSCNPWAENENGEHSYGAPQINVDFWGDLNNIIDANIRAEIVALAGGGLTRDFLLGNLDHQAAAAWIISRHGSDFNPWTTYTGGAYHAYDVDAYNTVRAIDAYVAALSQPAMDNVELTRIVRDLQAIALRDALRLNALEAKP